ncbi:MAG: histidine kinase [Pseudolysinimonas sp.]
MASIFRAWQLPRAPGAPAQLWRDWVLVSVLSVLAILEGFVRPAEPWLWPTVILELGMIATLLWRRTHPGVMVVIAFGASIIFDTVRQLSGTPPLGLYTMACALLLLYALVRWGSGRDLFLGGGVFLVSMLRALGAGEQTPSDLIGAIAIVTAVVALGIVFRYRAAVRVERLAQVRLQERERLARDLHDVVAHHVSAIAVQAQAGLATAASNPAAADEALRVIESEARLALGEMRSMVGVLRDKEPGARFPSPGLAQLQALADGDGLPVALTLVGEPEAVPAPIGNAVYRLVQESITNARRHAVGATRISVTVAVDAERVHVRVHDDGQAVAPRTIASGGFGLVGMSERAALLGGTVVAGPDPAGGWAVTAELPVKADAG